MVCLKGWVEVLVELIELDVLTVYSHSHASFRRWGRYPGVGLGCQQTTRRSKISFHRSRGV